MTFNEIRRAADRLRGIPLETVLDLIGAERDRHDRAKWHTDRGVISVTGMKFFNWNLSRGGGGAIDLVIHMKGLPFRSAVEWLSHHFSNAVPPSSEAPSPVTSNLKLPPHHADRLPDVIRYLASDRGINDSLIKSLIESGRLYADNRGNAVFPLLGKRNRPVGAEIRGTGAHLWRGMAAGSRKDSGYFSVPAPDAAAIILCESAIDAISCSFLYSDRLCISTSGARPNPLWLASLICHGLPVYCGFDSDRTGDRMASAMMALHPTVTRLRPPRHDWNDVLRSSW